MADIVVYESPQEIDARFLLLWLHGKSEKTIEAYRADILRFYGCVNTSLQAATLEDLQTFSDSLIHLKPTTRARALAAVKSALSFGLKTGYLKVNVGAALPLPRIEDTLAERIMTESNVARLLALETSKRNHAILALLYRAGLRVSELCNLTWRNMQERDQAGQISVFGKGKKTRQVLIDKETWQEVMNLRTPGEYVFQSRQARSRGVKADRRLDESMVHRIVAGAARRAGIDGHVSPHWMRHAHATHALENGAPITLVKETLGHKSIETTARYTHVRPNASSGQYLKV